MKKFSRGFWIGTMAAQAARSLIQDAMGKDVYIDSVQRNWMSPRWSVPLAILGLMLAMAVYVGHMRDAAAKKLRKEYRP